MAIPPLAVFPPAVYTPTHALAAVDDLCIRGPDLSIVRDEA